ncbi:MAG: hypothetical protein J5802_10485 [Butyrivibrio sp.]|nr:hypothetical protein [Butyrivibrio sp.]
MNSENNSRTSLFLMELIIAIFFFSLAAAVSIKLFVSAHTLAKSSTELSNATIWAQSLSEAFYGYNGDIPKIAELFPSSYSTQDTIIIVFDKEWNPLLDSREEAYYEALLKTETADASVVYSDVTDYGNNYSGKAVKGDVAVLNIQNTEVVPSSVPEDKSMIIINYSVDTLLDQKESE